ncbi:hypothetical protein L9F63_012167, partial [Diploptera punctata]
FVGSRKWRILKIYKRLRPASSRVVLRLAILSTTCPICTTKLPVSRQPLRMLDALSVPVFKRNKKYE